MKKRLVSSLRFYLLSIPVALICIAVDRTLRSIGYSEAVAFNCSVAVSFILGSILVIGRIILDWKEIKGGPR